MGSPGENTLILGKDLIMPISSVAWCETPNEPYAYPAPTETILTFKSMQSNNKPKVVIAHTIKGKGIDFMENKLLWHYKSPSEKEFNEGMNQLNMLIWELLL